MAEEISRGYEYLTEIGLDELSRLDSVAGDRIPEEHARRLLEQGRVEGRDLRQQVLVLFENPPRGALIKTRKEAGLPVYDATQEKDRILYKEILHPRTGKRITASIYLAHGGANPGGVCFGTEDKTQTEWLRRDGDISGIDIETKGREAVGKAKEREEMKRWLEAFKA